MRSGSVTFTLAGGGETLAELGDDVEDGRDYTLVAIAKPDSQGASLVLFEDGKPKAGTALLRAIHATPELGEPDVMVGDRTVAEKVGVRRGDRLRQHLPWYLRHIHYPSRRGRGAAREEKGVALTAGSATTEIVIGSRGEETRLMDAPATAPRRPRVRRRPASAASPATIRRRAGSSACCRRWRARCWARPDSR